MVSKALFLLLAHAGIAKPQCKNTAIATRFGVYTPLTVGMEAASLALPVRIKVGKNMMNCAGDVGCINTIIKGRC